MNYAHFAEKWLFDAGLFGLRLTEFDQECARKVTGCCYLIIDQDGYLAYVGKTTRRGLLHRIAEHREKRWFDRVFYIATDENNEVLNADNLEMALIRMFKPYANRQRYLWCADIRKDVWMLRQYGITHKDDWLLGIIDPPAPTRKWMPEPRRGDKPGDLSMRAAQHYGHTI